MFDYQTLKLMHPHGDEMYPMEEKLGHHDPAQHDSERGWLRGSRIFRCTRCAEEVVIAPPAGDVRDAETS